MSEHLFLQAEFRQVFDDRPARVLFPRRHVVSIRFLTASEIFVGWSRDVSTFIHEVQKFPDTWIGSRDFARLPNGGFDSVVDSPCLEVEGQFLQIGFLIFGSGLDFVHRLR